MSILEFGIGLKMSLGVMGVNDACLTMLSWETYLREISWRDLCLSSFLLENKFDRAVSRPEKLLIPASPFKYGAV